MVEIMKKILIFSLLSSMLLFSFENLTLENFEEKTQNKNVVLDFYSNSCTYCKVLRTNLIQYNKTKTQNVIIYKIDIDKEKELAKEFSVSVLPTLIYFQNDEIIERELGIKTAEQINTSVDKYLN